METQSLSKETNDGILLEAERFNHDLMLQFSELAGDCRDEDEYLNKAKELINEIRSLDAEELEDVFFGSITNTAPLYKTLDKLFANVEQVEKIPTSERHYD
ncbi:MAG: hypothetical protein JWQ40_3037 [Segetibacter sp.]|nr:hypothetical protein [Segetibacter sp.]